MGRKGSNILLSLLFVIIILVLNSCSLTALGIKEPREESFEEQKEYLEKNKLSSVHLYRFDGIYKDSLKLPSYYFIERDTASFSPIQFRMYNSNGEFISGCGICLGNAQKMNLYEEFPPRRLSWVKVNDSLNFRNDSQLLIDESGNKINPEEILKNSDYVIIAFWAEYLGKLSKRMLIDLENYIQKHNDKNIILLKVNLGNPSEKNLSGS